VLNVHWLYLYAKCIHDQLHSCIRSMEREMNENGNKFGVWKINYPFVIHLVPGWSYWLWCLFVELYLLGLLLCLSWSQRTCVLCPVIQRCNQRLWSQTCLVLWRISCELDGDTSSPAEKERGNDDSVTTSVLLTAAKTCFFNTSWILFFLMGLCNKPVNITHYTATNDGLMDEWWILKDLEEVNVA
jgi:hypothetical protein